MFLLVTICLMANLFFTIRVNEFKTSVQNGDLLMEEGLPLNALYQYRDAAEIMPLSTEGFMKALSALWQIYAIEAKHKDHGGNFKEIKGIC